MSRVEALVEPALLVWARESAGLDISTAARKVGAKPDRLRSWEDGAAKPTIKQLEKLGTAYKRPLAVFYLPEPPKDFQALRDFRRLPGHVVGLLSPELRYEIRRANTRRLVALDLYQEAGESPPEFSLEVSLSDDAEEVGVRIRRFLGIPFSDQHDSGPGYDSLNLWRSALEQAGVLVFQATGIDPNEMRGFSINKRRLPVVALNIGDAPRGRLFTMLHELVHVMLRRGGLCDLYEEGPERLEERRVEIFCNQVAGAALVPKSRLLKEQRVLAKGPRATWSSDDIRHLANRYGVSRETLLRRLLIFGRTTEAFYRTQREKLEKEYAEFRKRQQKEGGFAPPHRVAVSSAGPLFVRLVLESYYRDRITASDVSEFLAVRLKHLNKIEAEMFGGVSRTGVGR